MMSVVNSCLVTYVLTTSGQILAIYYTLYGLCKIKPLDGRTYVTKKQLISGLTPSCYLDIYSALYFIYVSLWYYHKFHLFFSFYSSALDQTSSSTGSDLLLPSNIPVVIIIVLVRKIALVYFSGPWENILMLW